jgi:hypothetical protein
MIVDFRTYAYAPSDFPAFLRMYNERGFAVTTRCLGTTLGIFTAHSGRANRTLQLFAYRDLDHRDECRARLRQDTDWLSFIKEAAPLIRDQENVILEPVAGPWRDGAGALGVSARGQSVAVFELRRERVSSKEHPGHLAGWSALCGESGPASVLRPLTGDMNTVYVLTRYASDAARAANLRDAAAVSPLLADGANASVDTELWLPTDYSPQL